MYEGQWENGEPHGAGQHTWYQRRLSGYQFTARNSFKGHFVAGARHGPGVFYYADGGILQGDWAHNQKHGVGQLICANGLQLEIEFDCDRLLTQLPPEASTQFLCNYGDLTPQSESAMVQVGHSKPDGWGVSLFFIIL